MAEFEPLLHSSMLTLEAGYGQAWVIILNPISHAINHHPCRVENSAADVADGHYISGNGGITDPAPLFSSAVRLDPRRNAPEMQIR